jgi:hypothetical protein
MKAWHFLRDDGRCQYGKHGVIEAGKTHKAKGPLVLCENGMHASVRLIDALRYAPGAKLCRVELSGEILKADDKVCARECTVLWMIDATMLLHKFACDEAERTMRLTDNPDPRSVEAIRVKRLWMLGEASDQDLAAARDAAWAAAWDAAWGAQNKRLTAMVMRARRKES